MHISRSAVVLVGLVAVGTTQISDAKKTRVRNLFTRKNEDLEHDAAKDAAFLKEALSDEDEQYWDRILQISASVPSAPTVPTPTAPAPTPAETTNCIQSGGTVQNAMCCRGVGDFPNTCTIGACGCSPFESEMVLTCVCPPGRCFNGNTCAVIPGQPTVPPPTVPPPVPTAPRPTVPPPVPTAPPPTNPPPPPTNPPPTNPPPPPTNPPPTNPPPPPTNPLPTTPPPTNPPPTNPPPTNPPPPPTNPPPTNPPPTNPPPTNPPPTNPQPVPTNPPPTNPPPTNPAPVPTNPAPPPTRDSSFSFVRRTRRQRRVKKRNDSDA